MGGVVHDNVRRALIFFEVLSSAVSDGEDGVESFGEDCL